MGSGGGLRVLMGLVECVVGLGRYKGGLVLCIGFVFGFGTLRVRMV